MPGPSLKLHAGQREQDPGTLVLPLSLDTVGLRPDGAPPVSRAIPGLRLSFPCSFGGSTVNGGVTGRQGTGLAGRRAPGPIHFWHPCLPCALDFRWLFPPTHSLPG